MGENRSTHDKFETFLGSLNLSWKFSMENTH
jgi:hypothetical protein